MDNLKLRQARKQKRWSIEKAAEKVGVSWLTYSRWEHGTQRPHPSTLDMLCDAFGLSPTELGFSDESSPEIESDETMKRREALQKIAATTGVVLMLSKLPGRSPLGLDYGQHQTKGGLSEDVLIGLATITQQYRVLQRSGITTFEDGLHGHIATIQHTLEHTTSEKYRRDLWRQLALSQLLARLNVTKKHEVARA